jgi:transglutaminase-like putative cysteine protease
MGLNRWGLAGTIVTALLALDAAYETFRAGSDERWWVAALAFIMVGVQIFLLSRQRAAAAAWCGVIGLLLFPLGGLWLSSIADRGVVMLGIETRALAVIAVAMGVGLAALAIATVPRMPRAGQIVIALLALYAIAAYAVGLREQTHLVDIVGGASLWSRLPYWLQGGFIGAAVLLPAALVIVITRSLLALGRRDGRHLSLQAVAILLCLLMVAPAFGLVAGRRAARDTTSSAPTTLPLPQTAPSPQPSAEISALPPRDLIPTDDATRRIADAQRRLPPLRFDRSGRAATLAAGHEAAFHFVRDHIGFDAYQGVLRGAAGAYLTRSGNAWDRALLLADFLRDKGLTARLARGTLDGATAERLYARLFTPPRAAPGEVADDPAPATGDNIILQRIRARAERDYRAVMAAYGDTLSVIGARAARAQAINELRDHVWVQTEVNGNWLDLDPTFPDSLPGQRVSDVTETIDAPPETVFQKVGIRVLVETLEGTATQEREVLSATRHAVDLVGRRIILAHTHTPPATAAPGVTNRDGDAWAPILWIDGETVAGQPVRFDSGRDAAAPLGRRGPELVAEWLEVTTERPDGTRDASRRALVDRRGTAGAPGNADVSQLARLPRNQVGPLAPQMLHAIWLTAGKHHLRDYTEAVAELITAVEKVEAPRDNADVLWAVGVGTFPIVAWSEHVLIPAANIAADVRVFADAPRVIVMSLGLGGPDQKRPQVEYDLLRDRVRSLARDASAEKAAVDRRVWFGMLEGALEHELGATAVAATGGSAADIVSTSGLLGAGGVVAIPPNQQPQHATVKSEDVAARMRPALDRGAAVVIPLSGDTAARGWWEIDTDGTTRAVLATGIAGAAYTHGGNAEAGSRPPSNARPPGTSGGSSSAWITPRGNDIGRLENGEWHRYARRPTPLAVGQEHSNLLALIAGAASAWSIVTIEAATVAITASHAVASIQGSGLRDQGSVLGTPPSRRSPSLQILRTAAVPIGDSHRARARSISGVAPRTTRHGPISALTASVRAALRAGSRHAASATVSSTPATLTMTRGSIAPISYSCDCSVWRRKKAPANPRTAPDSTMTAPSRRIIAKMVDASAPSASRIPISRVRCVT